MSTRSDPPVLSRGSGSFVYTDDGRELVDLSIGFGAAFLGHAHPAVTACLQEQAAQLLSCGRNPTPRQARVEALLAQVLPRGLRPAGMYSTGMEVVEFSLRLAAVHTGRREFAGFAKSMHGKSVMTSALCWSNSPVKPGNVHTLPFVSQAAEDELLDSLGRLLRTQRIAALLIEPIQGSNAALEASMDFYQSAVDLCREHGTLCVFDEILTGLHRTGTPFYVDRLKAPPDMLLFAKSMGNGFPVSALAIGDNLRLRPEALPGSTFSGNALALAAAEGTLTAMAALPMRESVSSIGKIVQSTLGSMQQSGVTLRGRGALWCLELGGDIRAAQAHALIREADLLVTCFDRFVRLLPAVTIAPQLLEESCRKIARALEQART